VNNFIQTTVIPLTASSIDGVQQQASAAISQVQATPQLITSAIQAASNTVQNLTDSIDTPQAQECLSNANQNLSQINNTARK
jgi:hypothetical protein